MGGFTTQGVLRLKELFQANTFTAIYRCNKDQKNLNPKKAGGCQFDPLCAFSKYVYSSESVNT